MIYYGTQTGTAEKFANILDEEAHIIGVNSRVVDMEKFTPEDFVQHSFVIFVLATHYEGDPTDNAKTFGKWLSKQTKAGSDTSKLLVGLTYSIMGLGDTSYEQFNEMALSTDRALSKMGAVRIGDIGAGNAETYTTEDDFIKWKQNIWSTIF